MDASTTNEAPLLGNARGGALPTPTDLAPLAKRTVWRGTPWRSCVQAVNL